MKNKLSYTVLVIKKKKTKQMMKTEFSAMSTHRGTRKWAFCPESSVEER